MIENIGTVAIYVEDQERSRQFWTEQVGFELGRSESMGPGGSWIEVAPTGSQTRLVLYPKSMMKNWEELKPSIVFECADIEKTYEKMRGNGVQFLSEPQKMNWGTFAQFRDPDGNTFLLKE